MAEYRDLTEILTLAKDLVCRMPSSFYNGIQSLLQEIINLPAADVAPVRHGRWIDTYGDSWKCSACGAESYVDEDWHGKDDKAYQMNYCHYCGAKMDKEARNNAVVDDP